MLLKDADGLGTSVDTDQTAPSGADCSGSAFICSDLSLPVLRIFIICSLQE